MGIGLAALALLAAVAALWVASAVGDHLRAPSLGGAQVTQGSSAVDGSSGVDRQTRRAPAGPTPHDRRARRVACSA